MRRLTATKLDQLEAMIAANPTDGRSYSTVFGIVCPKDGLLHNLEYANGEWQQTDRKADVYIAKKLELVLRSNKRFIAVVGGRGSGKSVQIVDISLAGVKDLGDKVYCLREFQNSLDDSVHSLISDEVDRLNFEGFSTQNNVISHEHGGAFKFKGLARNPNSIKSAAGFRRFVVEEAQFISDESLTALTPTARKKAKAGLPARFIVETDDDENKEIDDLNSVQMIFIANPGSSADPFSQRFIVPFQDVLDRDGIYEDDLHLIVRMNYDDNPWFEDSDLDGERRWCLENTSRAYYDHVWGGQFNDHVEDAIIMAEWFDACVDSHIKLNWKPKGAKFITHDPADSGDAKATCYRHGSLIVDVVETLTGDANSACDFATDFATSVSANLFCWDAQGVGLSLRRQITDALSASSIQLVEFFGSASVDNPEGIFDGYSEGQQFNPRINEQCFANLRAQRYWQLRERCYLTWRAVTLGEYHDPDKMISFSSEIKNLAGLRSEMCRIPRKRTGNGVFQVMSKEDMKSKLKMKSPNMTDAVMMSLCDWQPATVIDYSNYTIPSSGW